MNWTLDIFLVAVIVVVAGFMFVEVRQVELPEATHRENPYRQFLGKLFPASLIRQAGFLPRSVAYYYWGAKLLSALGCSLSLYEYTQWLAPSIMLCFVGFLLPDLWLLLRRHSRQRNIQSALTYFVELITAFLGSGQNLANAFEQAVGYGLSPGSPLRAEVELVVEELRVGAERSSAFTALAERTGVSDLQKLASLMEVGLRLGAPITDILRGQSEFLRERQKEYAEAMVNRRTLESLFPMMLVSFPLLLVVVFFPAGVQIVALFQSFSRFLQ